MTYIKNNQMLTPAVKGTKHRTTSIITDQWDLRIFPARSSILHRTANKFVSACRVAQEFRICHPSQPIKEAKYVGRPLIIMFTR